MRYIIIGTCKEGFGLQTLLFTSHISIDNNMKVTTPSTIMPEMSVSTEEITDNQDIGKLFINLLF